MFKERDFALLWSGQSVSSLGDGLFTIALALEALRLDHSPTGLAFVLAARALPAVCLALAGGVVVDRVPRRLAMLVSDVVRGCAVGVIALLVAKGRLELFELVIMSAVFGAADAFFGPASMAFVPELVPAELLVQANALSSTSSQFAQGLIGPAVGGLVVAAIGTSWSFGIDAMSFAVSALSLFAIRTRSRPGSGGHSPVAAAREGLRFVRRTRWLGATLLGAALANFFGIAPLSVLLPLLVRHVLGGGAVALGLVFAAGGAAGVVASLLVARAGPPKHLVVFTWSAYAVGGLAIMAMAFAPDVFVVGVLSATEVGLILYGDVLWVAMMQALVPKEMLGRVSSLVYLFAFALGPLGILAGGAAAASIGTRTALVVSGAVSGGICLVVIFIPGVRDPEHMSLNSKKSPGEQQGQDSAPAAG
ncbi:MAG: MFS transporter [Acidimicrobiales bacterium]